MSGRPPYVPPMGKGSIETLKTGFRARVYAGKDPITGRKVYLIGEVHKTRAAADKDRLRFVDQADAESIPETGATLSVLLDRWMHTVDHELSRAPRPTPSADSPLTSSRCR